MAARVSRALCVYDLWIVDASNRALLMYYSYYREGLSTMNQMIQSLFWDSATMVVSPCRLQEIDAVRERKQNKERKHDPGH